MTANHSRDTLDDIARLAARVRDLEASRSLGSIQRLDSKTLSVAASSLPALTVPSGSAYSTLRVAWSGRSAAGGTADYMCLRLNGDTSSSHYVWDFNQSNGATNSSAGSGGTDGHIRVGTLAASGATAGYIGSGEFVIPSANGTTAFKAPTGFSNSANASNNAFSGTYGGLWLSTVAVASITLFALNGNLAAGTTATLYGLP